MDETLMTIEILHGTTHDGPGMRTTVFTKGCPLHCRWCQNPESIAFENAVWWEGLDCIGCGSCIEACPQQAIGADEACIRIDRAKCAACGVCVEACPADAMRWQGQKMDMAALLQEVLKDKAYYRQSGGGVTCSGGEALMQYEFVAEFFKNLKAEGVSTALDTCGFAPQKNLQAVLLYTDYLLYDLKLWDDAAHRLYTGASNKLILENLLYAAEFVRRQRENGRHMEIWIRTPLIPGATASAENIAAIGAFIRQNIADTVARWELCAFNGLCGTKYERLGVAWPYRDTEPMCRADILPLKAAALAQMPEEKVFFAGAIRA